MLLKEEIIKNEKAAPSIFKMTIYSPYIADNAQPGQFINIKCSEGLTALLRRPISICRVDRARKEVEFLYQIKGTGTEYLSRKKPGDLVDVMGPLGKGFWKGESERIAVVGGGIGIFPLLFLLEEKQSVDKYTFLGFRSIEFEVLKKEFKTASSEVMVSTDDGSLGYKGLVTDLLEEKLKEIRFDIIYTCGPTPMIKKVIDTANRHDIPCQVSMEQRMGCGIGACLVCACKTKAGSGWEYSHVCKDGPVFWSNEVILDE